MSPTIVPRHYPVVDDFGVVRAMVLIYPHQDWICKQRLNQVLVAISFVLGETVQDMSCFSPGQFRNETARRMACRPAGYSADVVGWMAVCDERDAAYVLVSVFRGREDECQKVASAVCFTIARFDRMQMYLRVYEM